MDESVDEMPLRAGNLGRVSKDKSDRLRSVSEQHGENRAEIDANGWLEVASYEDEGSASRFATKQRPDWTRLVADVDAGNLDVIVMWEPSRGSRKLGEWVDFLDSCRERRVLIHVTSHHRTYDMSQPRDWRAMAEDGLDASWESEKTSERVRRSLQANARNGMPHGICKYGYVRIHDERTGQLLGQRPVPEHAAVCAEIITRVAAGVPVSAIRDDLEKRQVPPPTGKIWYRRTITRIATSPVYIGKLRVEGELIDGKWEPIPGLKEDLFWAAQHVLNSPSRKTTRPGRARHLLSYIMCCDACGSPVVADARRAPVYTCSEHQGHNCQIPMGAADAFVTGLVQRRAARPDFYENLTSGDDERVIQARAEAERLQSELDGWATADISARAYALREAKLKPLIDAANARAEELSVPPALRELATPGTDIAARWEAMHIAARREVIRYWFPKLRLVPGKGPAHQRIVYPEG